MDQRPGTNDTQHLTPMNDTCQSMPGMWRLATSIPLVLLTLAVAGCSQSTEVTTRAAGHPIRAVIQGNHSIESHPDQGVITSPFGKVLIEPSRVRVDRAPWATVPEGALIKVSIARGRVRVNAGGVTVSRTGS